MDTAKRPAEAPNCRICRCEATDSHPLFHPCKCRGSIKYIHQDCLQDWLAHSQKDTCDICHTRYTFLDIFATTVPERPPVRLLFRQLMEKLIALQYFVVKYFLIGVCALLEVPAFINAVDRITDWQLGVQVPTLGMVQSLIYGDYIPTNDSYANIVKVLENTIFRGLTIGVFYFVLVASMLLIQNSIVTDDGFQKIINKKIGKDLKPHLRDAVQRQNMLRQQEQQAALRRAEARRADAVRQADQRAQAARDALRGERAENINAFGDIGDEVDEPSPLARRFEAAEQLPMGENVRERNEYLGGLLEAALDTVPERGYEGLRAALDPDDVDFKEVIDGLVRLDQSDEELARGREQRAAALAELHDSDARLARTRTRPKVDPSDFPPSVRTVYENRRRQLANMGIPEEEIDNVMFPPENDPHYDERIAANSRRRERIMHAEREAQERVLANQAERRRLIRIRDERRREQRMMVLNALLAAPPGGVQDLEPLARQQQPWQQQENPQRRVHPENDNDSENEDDDDDNDLQEPDNVDDFWAGPKNISFITQVTILANLVSCAVIVTMKMIPSFIGLVVIHIIEALVDLWNVFVRATIGEAHVNVAAKLSSYLTRSNSWQFVVAYSESNKAIALTKQYLKREIIDPYVEGYISDLAWKPLDTFAAKMIMIIFGYTTIGVAVAMTMWRIERSCSEVNPLTKSYRGTYIVMLQLTQSLKVLVLMGIEWVVFPFYTGFLIQFALVAFSSESLYSAQLPAELMLRHWFGVIPVWFMGTFFMYYFATFVAMIRKDILRPGVLFFIRPSDDPNVRLIHDALMRPFGLKISRILLSSAVYTLYIFVEIIGPMWLLRLCSPIPIFPAHHRHWCETLIYMSLFLIAQNMSEPFVRFWKSVFKIACSWTRLSSFFLDVERSEERGRVAYKNVWAMIKRDKPDYNIPTQQHLLVEFFAQHPSATSAFIPDGDFVRAPDNDTVSRKFVRTLFVPVTKSDVLLGPLPEVPDDEHIFNPYDDDEPLDSTTYTLVYRPPHFKTRIAVFFAILFFGSMLFTFGIYFSNSMFKLTVKKLLGGIFPNDFYQIDPWSLLITVAVISNWHNLLVFERENEENGVFAIIQNMINRITANELVQYYAERLWLMLMIPTLIGFGNQRLLVKKDLTWIDIIFAQILLIPLAFALSHRISKPSSYKFYSICTVVFVIIRLATLWYFTSETGKETGSFVVDFSAIDFSTTTPVFMYFMRYMVLNDPLGTEGDIFYTCWIFMSSLQLLILTADYWSMFTNEVKQKYYSTGKILTNVDLDEDSEENE